MKSQTHNHSRSRRAGFSLIEVLLGTIVLVVALLGTMGSITSTAVMGESTREINEAYLAAHRMMEELQGETFGEVFFRYNGETRDDLPGDNPGIGFAVPGLDPVDGDEDGLAGRIIWPTTAAAPDRLFEDTVDPTFGMPRDLNADGVIDAANHSGDYVLLPVRVRVDWTGPSGDRFIEVETILGQR